MLACNLNKIEISNNISLKSEGFTVSFSNSISDLTTDWNQQAEGNLFLNGAFLSALEAAPPSGTSYRYGLVSKNGQQVGIVYYQLKKINLYLSLRLDAYSPSGFVDKMWHGIKSFLAKRINQYVLVNGNMTLTGNNGFLFSDSIVDQDQFSLVDEISDQLVCKLRNEKIKVKAILLKDYRTEEKANKGDWVFSEFQVQPNMIMKIDQEWTSFEDYIMAMRSKYRVRVRRARKKAESLEKRQLSLEEIHSYADDIASLYRNVADQAGFNLFMLPKNYFYSLQKQLGEHMKLVAYFEEGKMVGYYTHIINGEELDAHFLGYDPTCNKNCQLYLNMLYDLVDDAIQLKAHNLILSRTAMEIKSSIGAEAHNMFLYMRMINPFLNKGVSAALDYFKPSAEWQPRSPFK